MGTLPFSQASLSFNITFEVADDEIFEDRETFTAVVSTSSPLSGVTPKSSLQTLTVVIEDNEGEAKSTPFCKCWHGKLYWCTQQCGVVMNFKIWGEANPFNTAPPPLHDSASSHETQLINYYIRCT